MSKIYVARHGETDWNAMAKIQGHTPHVPLNEKGREQAHALRKKVSRIGVNHIFSSDQLRAKETAEIVNLDLGLDIVLDERLRERNFGNLEGKIFHDISEDDWAKFDTNPKAFNAESSREMYDRVKSFLDETRKTTKGNVLLVSHGGTLKMVLHHEKYDEFNEKEFRKDFLVPLPNAGLIELGKRPANQELESHSPIK